MNPDQTDIVTVQQLLFGGLAALSTAFIVLWKIVVDNFKDLRKRAEACEQDRAELWKAMARKS